MEHSPGSLASSAFTNSSFMIAGWVSVKPVFFILSVGLILSRRLSGHIGADYFLLPRLGTPWSETEGQASASGRGDRKAPMPPLS